MGPRNAGAPGRGDAVSHFARTLRDDLELAQAPERARLTAAEITAALHRRHRAPEWIFVSEVSTGTGAGAIGRIDGWALNCYPSKRMVRIAFEVKVSRGDFLRDIKQPRKHAIARLYSNEFYFVAPRGLLKPEEMPDYAGLLEVIQPATDREPWLLQALEAPWRDTDPPSWQFLAAVYRAARSGRLEANPPSAPAGEDGDYGA
jgi:hypothetical protein